MRCDDLDEVDYFATKGATRACLVTRGKGGGGGR